MDRAGRWLTEEYQLKRKPGTSGVYYVASRLVFRTGEGLQITVLPGWETDGASVPALLRWWAPPFAGPYTAAASGHIDDILIPAETRPRLIAALELLRDKQAMLPPKKHGCMPL